MSIEQNKLKNIIEAALMAVAKPMTVEQLMQLFAEEERPSTNAVKEAITALQADSTERGVELKEVASGYRYQAKQEYSEWLSRLWEEKPAKYSRAALETLALIAYRQPVTRAEIEDVRGVGVSSSIIKTMIEREWIRVVGHRDVPGRPALYATTKQFLDYFNMKSLEELPTLAEIKDLEDLNPELDLPNPDDAPDSEQAPDAEHASDTDQAEAESSSDSESDPSVAELDEQDIAASIPSDNQSEAGESFDPNQTDAHLQTDVFDELDDVHTETINDSFYADEFAESAEQSDQSSYESSNREDGESNEVISQPLTSDREDAEQDSDVSESNSTKSEHTLEN